MVVPCESASPRCELRFSSASTLLLDADEGTSLRDGWDPKLAKLIDPIGLRWDVRTRGNRNVSTRQHFARGRALSE